MAAAGAAVTDARPLAMARQVREASSSLSELRRILRPYIESQIIQPCFDAINERLQEQVAPELRQRLDELRTQAQEVREQLQGVDERLARQPAVADRGTVAKGEEKAREKDWASLWEALHGALDRSEQALQSLFLEPPRGDPDWWYSVAAKLRTLEELGKQAVEDLRAQEVDAVADELTGRLDQALEQQGALENEMKRTLAPLEKQFDRQQEQMQSLGATLIGENHDSICTALQTLTIFTQRGQVTTRLSVGRKGSSSPYLPPCLQYGG